MNVYHRLAAGAALSAIALTAAVPADAKPRKQATARKHTVDPRDAKIRALEAKIDALTARLDAQEAAQQSTAQTAQSAQAVAAAAQNQATNALTQSEAAQTQLAQIKVTPPPKPEAPGWWGNTAISGKAFLNVSSINQTTTGLNGDTTDDVLSPHGSPNGIETELKRFYVGIDHKFNNTFSANITTDFRYGTNGTSNDVLVYVKKAFLQAKLSPAFTVRVGAADLPWVPFVEGVYGYRFVENTLIDRTKFGTSSDWGVHLLGGFGNGLVNYQVSAIDGNGYKTLTRNSNTIDLEGRIDVHPIKPIVLAVGGYTGKRGKSNDAFDVNHTVTRFNALLAYTDKRVRAGVEYFHVKNWNNITTALEPGSAPDTPNDNGHGWSAFGSFAFTPAISAFARYDWVKPTEVTPNGVTGDPKDNYLNIGINYKPIGPIDLALVYKHDHVDNTIFDTTNGKIGGLDHGKYDEVGLFGQLVF